MGARAGRLTAIFLCALSLVLIPLAPAYATHYIQTAYYPVPVQVAVLQMNSDHCIFAPPHVPSTDGCIYTNAANFDEVAFFDDLEADGYVIGVYWQTEFDAGNCRESFDLAYDARQWCHLPDIAEGTTIYWKVGTCKEYYGYNCSPGEWDWSRTRVTHA